ncbi:hypothetical protein G6M89_08600 [Natronolimnobius sp. AArcel1]|uniref:hypothetical protein n=1 Tax=Natronolimnobius sp. AArcel1 TaxID=1679093 RepID=UPI0013EB6BBB|nr:hypothetical protein [Natronolimnobius sp. AArcel1]NGM69068.1 hypothetical protein [Natronolimnobius sp. AArcel1]
MNLQRIGRAEEEYTTERYCDGCPTSLEDGDYVATYFCDTKWGGYVEGKLPTMAQQESYCLTCYNDRIPLPRKGTKEGFSFEVLHHDKENGVYRFEEKGVMRFSKEDEGIEWHPPDVIETIFPFTVNELEYETTPMSAYLAALKHGIDLRGYVKDGELQIPDSAVPTAREIAKQNSEYSSRYSFDSDML